MRTLCAQSQTQEKITADPAIDGHAKNFSIRLLPQGRYRLTPFYDVVSALPVLCKGRNQWSRQKLAIAMVMAVEGTHRHYHWWQMQRRHFNHMAQKYGYSQGAEAQIQHLIEATPRVIEEVSQQLPADFSLSVADAIFSGLTASALMLFQMPAS